MAPDFPRTLLHAVPWTRSHAKRHIDHVKQADEGCGLDFLIDGSSPPSLSESH